MSFNGHIVEGKVVTDELIPLPDGTEVRVEAADAKQSFLERHRHWIGAIDSVEDGALNHDHYLYGAPKRT